MTTTRTCIKWCVLDGMEFIPGNEYTIDYNPVDGRIYIYNVWGSTTISLRFLNNHFI